MNSVFGAIFHFKANRKQLVPFSVVGIIYHIQRALPVLLGFTKHSCFCVDTRSVLIPIITFPPPSNSFPVALTFFLLKKKKKKKAPMLFIMFLPPSLYA